MDIKKWLESLVVGQVVRHQGRPALVVELNGTKTLKMLDTISEEARVLYIGIPVPDGRKYNHAAKGSRSVEGA